MCVLHQKPVSSFCVLEKVPVCSQCVAGSHYCVLNLHSTEFHCFPDGKVHECIDLHVAEKEALQTLKVELEKVSAWKDKVAQL